MSFSGRRRILLIEPRLQLRVGLAFVVGGLVSALVSGVVYGTLWMSAAERLPHDRHELQAQALGLLSGGFLLAAVLLAPLLLVLGLVATFPIFGPLHRFRVYLKRVASGDHPDPCRIRREDELQDLCELLNQVTAPLRAAPAADEDASERTAA